MATKLTNPFRDELYGDCDYPVICEECGDPINDDAGPCVSCHSPRHTSCASTCDNCQDNVCGDCKVSIDGMTFCVSCAEELIIEKRQEIAENQATIDKLAAFIGKIKKGIGQ